MDPRLTQAWFRIAVFLVLISAFMLPFLPRDSAEFVVATLTLIIGLVLGGIVVVIVKVFGH